MKIKITLLVLVIFALCPTAKALTPSPDGGYPGGNTAEGQRALFSLTTGTYNTAVGLFSLLNNEESNFNTAIGAAALLANAADENTAIGAAALLNNTTGLANTANGAFALLNNTQGAGNTASGADALLRNVIGIGNTATGRGALSFSTGDLNTAIGYTAGNNVATASNVICVGAQVAGADVNDSCFIGNIWAQPGGPQAVYVNIDGKLGAQVSSRRFKDNIKPMDKSSRALYSLKPITFRYKKEIDPARVSQFGLLAEEVEKVNPDLVVHDKEGKPFSVRYDQVNAMLLNEFLKAHRTIERQQKQIDALAAQLNEQAAHIQKVSAQIDLVRSSPQTAATDP